MRALQNILNNIAESSVKVDNTMVWNGTSAPFFESYTLKLNHPEQKWALWTQYALNQVAGSHAADSLASLTGIFIDHLGHKVVIKKSLELAKHEIIHSDQFIAIDDSSLSLAESSGYLADHRHTLKWDMLFEDPVESFKPFPTSLMYHLSWPKTKFITPRLKTFATGQIFINHKRKDFRHLPVYQSHQYGKDFVPGWFSANCLQFKEDPTAVFEALAIKTSPKASSQSQIVFFLIRFAGETYIANGLMDQFFNQSRPSDLNWDIEFSKNGLRFVCRIKRIPELVFGREQQTPDRNPLYCYNSLLSEIEIQIYEINKMGKHIKTLTSAACSFESASRHQIDDFSLDLKEAHSHNESETP